MGATLESRGRLNGVAESTPERLFADHHFVRPGFGQTVNVRPPVRRSLSVKKTVHRTTTYEIHRTITRSQKGRRRWEERISPRFAINAVLDSSKCRSENRTKRYKITEVDTVRPRHINHLQKSIWYGCTVFPLLSRLQIEAGRCLKSCADGARERT